MKAKNLLLCAVLTSLSLLATCFSGFGQTVIDNDKIRSGNGSETSINARGNMQQPFYKMGSSWFKLTYSNYPLNATFAVGGDGSSEWNLSGTLLNDPILVNHDINTDGFNYNSGSTGAGTGTVVSTGELSFPDATLQAEHTYELLPGNSFIKVKMKLTNQSSSDAENVRVWIGTRDDWVGSTDRPTKQRGNLVDGSFEQISVASERASVVRVTSNSEGVLFYTDTDKANSIVHNCCSWSNVVNQFPETSNITHSSDGSYGFFVRLNDLGPGESDEFTWYYAAGALDELDEITDQVAQASGAVSEITCTAAEFQAQSSESGTGYYTVVPSGATAPTAEQIKAGVDYDGVAVVNSGSAAMTGGTPHLFNIENLTHSTGYTAYFVLENTVPEFSEISNVNFTSGAPFTVSISTTPSATCGTIGDGTATAAVNGGTAPFAYEWSSGETTATIADKAFGTYNAEVTDSGGCPSVTAAAEITTQDNTAPVAIAQNITLYADETGAATLAPESVNNGSTDDCEIASLSLSQSAFDCDDVAFSAGQAVTLTVTDQNGNTANAIAQVTVIDTINPIIAAQNIVLELDEDGQSTADANEADSGSTDNCGISSRTLSKTDFTCEDLGINTVVFTVADASGNQRSTEITVEVRDEAAPALAVQNLTVSLDENASAIISAADAEVSSSDNCGITEKELSRTEFGCADLGTPQSVTLTASDAYGNETVRTFQVTVTDEIAPVAIGRDIVLELDENGTAEIVNTEIKELADADSYDNCTIPESGYSLDKTAFNCADLGENTAAFTVTDLSGNSASTEIKVTVRDSRLPVAVVEDITLTLDENGQASLDVATADKGSTDNCEIVHREIDQEIFSCADLGERPVTLTLMDGSDNTAEASFNVTIVDETAPVVTFVEAPVVYIDEYGIAAIDQEAIVADVTDNCSISSTHFDIENFDCTQAGVRTLQFIAEDASGNITTTSTQVQIADTIKPSFSLNTIQVLIDEDGLAQLDGEILLPYASDNCGIAEVVVEHTSMACHPSGVGYTDIIVYDLHGNHLQHTLQVEFQDETAPEVTVQDISVTLDENGIAELEMDDLTYTATDNCGIASLGLSAARFDCSTTGISKVTLTAIDHYGNQTEAAFNVIVKDTEAPKFDPIDELIFCSGHVDFARSITAYDNCEFDIEQRTGPASGSVLEAGSYTATFVATDKSGNSTSLEASITVHPTPRINAPFEIEVTAGEPFEISVDGQDYTSLTWSNGDSGPIAVYTVVSDELIWFTASNRQGCEYTQRITLLSSEALNTGDETEEASLNVFPNPTNGELNLVIDGAIVNGDYVVSITDLQGKLLLKKAWNNPGAKAPLTLDTSNLPGGMYLVNLHADKQNHTVKFMKF